VVTFMLLTFTVDYTKIPIKVYLMGKDKVTLKIPRPLYNKLQRIIEETGFSSVNEFVVYILRDLAALQKGDDKELSADEVRLIKERLKNLGYL